jgi:2,3-bisphosphoglycerate-dependent phosphoglycerate mutase
MQQRPSLLVLVRHAESARNKVKGGNIYFAGDEERASIKGIPDHEIPITPEGGMRAEKTGIALRERFGTFDYAYHSGYRRTIETLDQMLMAYPEAERSQIKVRMNQFIRERDPGHAYDMTKDEAEKAFPWLQEYWQTFGGFFAQPPGGESLSQVAQRVYLFLNMLFRDRAGKKVLVTTHGGTLRCFRLLLEHWTYDQALKWPPGQSPENCGVTVYEYDSLDGRLFLKEYNTVCE